VAPEDSSYYNDWLVRHMYVMVPLKDVVGKFMATFKDFPVRQEPGSFTPQQ
jgi:arylsulfatase